MSSHRSVECKWRGDLCCDVDAGGFALVVDEPEQYGGTNLGPQPTELLLASIASCFTLAIAYAAQKQSIELDSLSVRAVGTYDGPKFSAISIESQLGCDEIDVEPLVRSAERICYVTNTLKSGIDIRIEAAAASMGTI